MHDTEVDIDQRWAVGLDGLFNGIYFGLLLLMKWLLFVCFGEEVRVDRKLSVVILATLVATQPPN